MATEHAAAPTWAPIIDTHVHVLKRGLPLVPDATNSPDYDFTPEDFIATLERAGVVFGVVTAPSFYGTDNDYLVAALRAHRRLRGTVILKPDADPLAMRAMADAGVVGLRFSLRSYPVVPDLSQPEWQRMLRRVQDLDWYVHLLAESARSAQMVPILEKSGVKIVIDHYGVPEQLPLTDDPGFSAVMRAVKNGRAWVKLSAPYRNHLDIQTITDFLLAEAGPERLLWGSDCPWVAHEGRFSYRDTIGWFEATVPDRATREAIGKTGLALNKFI